MEDNNVPNPDTEDFLALAQQLADEKKSAIISIDGKNVKVTEPDSLKLMQFFQSNMKDGEIDVNDEQAAMNATIGIVKLCLPEGLTDEQVFSIMLKAGYMQEECELRDVVEGYVDTNKFFDAGNSEQADADFTQPEPSESA